MAIKKKLTILLIAALTVCLFFAFGFQIDVIGVVSKDGGTADVSLSEPLRVAADEAKAALAAAELAVSEAEAALAAAEQAVIDAPAAVTAAELALEEAEAALEILLAQVVPPVTPEEITAAELVVSEVEAALAAAEQAVIDAPAAVTAAELALEEAEAALEEAKLAAEAALAAYSGLKTRNAEELEALQLAVDEANAALDKALEEGEAQGVIDELQLAADEANSALEEYEPGENRIMYSHVIINSNNGGSFTGESTEGNYSGVDGEEFNFTFESDPGFDLVWLRVGNTKFATAEDAREYIYSSDKKNLTIHAHFKKDKDYSPEVTFEEDLEPGDEDDDEKGKGKDKEKSNNGKKKDK